MVQVNGCLVGLHINFSTSKAKRMKIEMQINISVAMASFSNNSLMVYILLYAGKLTTIIEVILREAPNVVITKEIDLNELELRKINVKFNLELAKSV